jgi:small neutral amino acid transporter SnatA (MarC family)
MRSSLCIIRIFGRTGIMVLTRILGILLAALAIQFAPNGIDQFLIASKIVK